MGVNLVLDYGYRGSFVVDYDPSSRPVTGDPQKYRGDRLSWTSVVEYLDLV